MDKPCLCLSVYQLPDPLSQASVFTDNDTCTFSI